MATIKQGTLFPTTLITEMFSLVKGHSSVAKMIGSTPIAFNGNTQFTFSMDSGVSVVGEAAQKPEGDAKIAPVTIRPIKIVYQSRVTNEFQYASEEARLNYLRSFADGFAKKLGEGLDEMILHGVNPASGTAATQIIGNNNLDYAIGQAGNEVTYGTGAADKDIDDAIAMVDSPNGIILGKTIRSDIAALEVSKSRKYPEFAWGATPATLGGMKLDTNKTVESNSAKARAYVGDWNSLKWGYAKNMPLEVIEYGDPDGQGDLKRTNEVVLRSEAFIGWGILNGKDFAVVKSGD